MKSHEIINRYAIRIRFADASMAKLYDVLVTKMIHCTAFRDLSACAFQTLKSSRWKYLKLNEDI